MSKLPSSEHRDHPTLTIQDGYGQNREAVMERNNIVIGRETGLRRRHRRSERIAPSCRDLP